jgi:release factor glutamine methyltransferase
VTLLTDATARLAAAGIATPRVDAELLLAHALRVPRSRLVLVEPDADALAAFEGLLVRRESREPLQHIVGTAPFRHIEIPVGPGVFVPRPETELLVDAVLEHLRAAAEPVVVDLCSGSGTLALAIADEVPAGRVIAVEQAGEAACWLARNATGTRVEPTVADVRDPHLLPELRGRVDAVVANPPYVPSGVEVSPEVRADPPDAVFAGAEGLALMPSVIARAAELLRPDGAFAVEHDDTHETAVPDLLRADGRFTAITAHRDLAGLPRFATARRVR